MLNSKISRTYNRTGAFSGVDIVSTSDSLVTSIQPGLVLYAGYLPGAGECLLIQSTDGSLLGYSNLGECLKKSGNFVKASEVIGYSKLRKIRFSLWINGSPVDPTPLFQASIQ
jgi:septal ring factor EnvC (AmiA/AmiB activator)